MNTSLAERIDAALPQTQCTRCGYDGCRPYAEAVAAGAAEINRCPPGGDRLIARLAELTGRPPRRLDPDCGEHGPLRLAAIDETRCIGCTLCIQACPVDAIIGAAQRMHVVLRALCSGCELCVAPCPVDCIALVPAEREWSDADAAAAHERHVARARRLAAGERIADRIVRQRETEHDARALRQAAIAAALERARARRAARTTT